jgi:hypothetical protein
MSTAVKRSRPSDHGELLAIAFQRSHESDHIKPASIKAPSKAEVKDWATAAHMGLTWFLLYARPRASIGGGLSGVHFCTCIIEGRDTGG